MSSYGLLDSLFHHITWNECHEDEYGLKDWARLASVVHYTRSKETFQGDGQNYVVELCDYVGNERGAIEELL